MSKSTIASVATSEPEGTFSQEQAIDQLEQWLGPLEDNGLPFSMEKSRRIFENAGVRTRHSVKSVENLTEETHFGQKSEQFLEEAPQLGLKTVRGALDRADISPDEIDFFITVSCTGFSIPSIDAHIMNQLNFSPDTRRLPIAELGCAGGASALCRAHDFLTAHPEKTVLLLSVELCTLNFQPNDLTRAQVVSGALFGDGSAAVVLTGSERNDNENSPSIVDYESHFFEDTLNYMGYKNNEHGMSIMLSPRIPAEVKRSGNDLVTDFLRKHGLSIPDIDHWVVHPGGRAILDALEDALELDSNDLDASKYVLEEYGNLSSATVLYVMEETFSRNPSPDDKGILMAFGPGFNADMTLLEW